MKDVRKIILAGSFIFTAALAVVFLTNHNNNKFIESQIDQDAIVQFENREQIGVEIVDTPETLQLGLGERDSLAEGHGMLFLFPTLEEHRFWMKGMRFAIDIIWLDGEEIVHISKNADPEVLPLTIYAPKVLSDTVLEVNAGVSDSLGLKVGDMVDIQR